MLGKHRHPALRLASKVAVGVAGTVITAVGLLLVPLPGPGWLIVFGGLALLATEFSWAARVLSFARHRVAAGTAWLRRRSAAMKAGLTAAGVLLVAAALLLVDLLLGLPAWVPLL